jgi:glycosyltransferase involved in cell wall biosynthesis
MGHEVKLVFLRGSELSGYTDLLDGLEYEVISQTGDSFVSPVYERVTKWFAPQRGPESRIDYNLIRQFPHEISQSGFDYIICHDQFAGLGGYYASRKLGMPYSVYMHERVGNFSVPLLSHFANWYEGRVLKSAAGVFLVTPKIGESIYRKHGVVGTPNYFGMDLVSSASFEEKDQSIIAVSMWDLGRKPWEYLPVLQRLPTYRFRIVGRWRVPEAKQIFVRRCAELGLSSRVDLLEGVSESELDTIYDKSKFYLRFGFGEYGSGSSIECIEHRVPLVMNGDIGTSDLVRDYECGAVLDVDNPAGIASWILEHDNPDAYRTLQQNLAVLSAQFSWKSHCEKLLAPVIHA